MRLASRSARLMVEPVEVILRDFDLEAGLCRFRARAATGAH